MSYLSRGAEVTSRPPSPFSDSDDDVRNCDQLQLRQDDIVEWDPLLRDEFQYPDPKSLNYMVLNTRFNVNARRNVKVPYPRETEERKLYTDQQRLYASRAQVPEDSTDFAIKVRPIMKGTTSTKTDITGIAFQAIRRRWG
jgi:hypothetical protein